MTTKKEESKPIEIKEENIDKQSSDSFVDTPFYPSLKVDKLFIKFINTTAQPSILAGQIILWYNNTNYYILANFNGTTKKVQLT